MMTSPLLMFSKLYSSYYYFIFMVVLVIFNLIQYENAIVGAADNPNNNNLMFDVSSCSLKEPYYNHTFDLSVLKSDLERQVLGHTNKEKIRFNFCSSNDRKCADKDNVHACLEKNDKEYVLATSQKITYNNGRITFKFDGGESCESGRNYQLIVDVGCDYTIDSKLYSVEHSNDSCIYHVKFEDSRACLPLPDGISIGSCKVTDKNYAFDFSPLGEYNYRVSDRKDSEFILNPCQPVLYDFNATCPAGSSVCLYSGADKLSERFVNYGTINSKPIIEDNNPVIIYDSNTKCNKTHNFKSKIYFSCDWNNEYGQPVYNRFADCTHHFVWQTLFACRTDEKDHDDIPCILKDSSTNFIFNMSSLANKYYDSTFNGKKYSFAICESNDNNNGAYLAKGDKKENRGRISSILLRDKTGVPYLSYDSDVRCSDAKKWKTEIYFICSDHTATENKIEVENDTDCTLRINFETKLACQYDVSCKLPEYAIDLTSLINVTGYYIAKVNDSLKDVIKSKEFFINVCRPIKNININKCYDGSGACIASLDGSNKIIDGQSLGHPTVKLTKIGDSVAELKYYNGGPCPDENKENLTSSIKFYCDHKAGKGLPILQSIVEKCHYEFDWATNAICPQHSVIYSVDTCKLINEVIDVNFDLKNAKFTGGKGIITEKNSAGTNNVINLCKKKDLTASVDYSRSIVTMFFKLNVVCAKQESNDVLIQLNLVCSGTENRTTLPVGNNCSLVITQNTPEICPFLGILTNNNNNNNGEITPPLTIKTTTITAQNPKSTEATTTTTAAATIKPTNSSITTKTIDAAVTSTTPTAEKSTTKSSASVEPEPTPTTPTTNKTTTDNNKNTDSGSMSASGVIVTFLFCFALFIGCTLVLLRNENIRNKVRGVLTRNSNNGVQYSRVRHEDAANLLLQNVPNEDSDDEMLL